MTYLKHAIAIGIRTDMRPCGLYLCWFVAVVLGAFTKPVMAGEDPDWPCIQRKVPELSAGMMWGGPPLQTLAPEYAPDQKMAALIDHLAVRRTPLTEAETQIEQFVNELPVAERNNKLGAVFLLLLKRTNHVRNDILKGISRYMRKQKKLSGDIQTIRGELESVLSLQNPTVEDRTLRRAIEEKLNWQTRIFDERQQSLVYVCELPVLMEQRIFALARILSGKMDTD